MSSAPVLELAHSLIPGLKQGAGSNWSGYCPLHGETPGKSTRSFSFNASTGQWYCFAGCGGGHLRSLLKGLGRSRNSIDLTMQRLDRFLVKVDKRASPVKRKGLFQTQYPLPERILGLFEQCPVSLLEEGFDEDLLWRHDVGYDSERKWITFPIRDVEGTLAGISARTNDPHQKYKVYRKELQEMGFPRYELEKGDYLWRWDIVYPQVYMAGERPTIYVVEGFKAALWMVQCGFENTVALMGSSMSDVQRVFLERLGGTVIWCLDHDRTGQKMTDRNATNLHGVRQLVMRYPDTDARLQPDDLSEDDLVDAVENSLRLSRWRARRQQQRMKQQNDQAKGSRPSGLRTRGNA